MVRQRPSNSQQGRHKDRQQQPGWGRYNESAECTDTRPRHTPGDARPPRLLLLLLLLGLGPWRWRALLALAAGVVHPPQDLAQAHSGGRKGRGGGGAVASASRLAQDGRRILGVHCQPQWGVQVEPLLHPGGEGGSKTEKGDGEEEQRKDGRGRAEKGWVEKKREWGEGEE